MMYTIIDNKGGLHSVNFSSDSEAVSFLCSHFRDYIYSVLRSDPVALVSPDSTYIGFIRTSSGEFWYSSFYKGV